MGVGAAGTKAIKCIATPSNLGVVVFVILHVFALVR